jgi:hypothetical protein
VELELECEVVRDCDAVPVEEVVFEFDTVSVEDAAPDCDCDCDRGKRANMLNKVIVRGEVENGRHVEAMQKVDRQKDQRVRRIDLGLGKLLSCH